MSFRLLALAVLLLAVPLASQGHALVCAPHNKMTLDECQTCINRGYSLRWIGKSSPRGTGGCQLVPRAAGAACTEDGLCDSQLCRGGFCCASSLPCAIQPARTCGTDGTCAAGTGLCSLRKAGAVCIAANCTTVSQGSSSDGGYLNPEATCDGNGQCVAGVQTQCADNFACANGKSCAQECADGTFGSANCTAYYRFCDGGTSCITCFAASMLAQRDDGATLRFDQLRVGDRVLAFDSTTGLTEFSAVSFFSSVSVNVTAEAVTVRVEGVDAAADLVLSPPHLLLASTDALAKPTFVQAMDVRPGVHWVWLAQRGGEDAGKLVPRRVASASASRITSG